MTDLIQGHVPFHDAGPFRRRVDAALLGRRRRRTAHRPVGARCAARSCSPPSRSVSSARARRSSGSTCPEPGRSTPTRWCATPWLRSWPPSFPTCRASLSSTGPRARGAAPPQHHRRRPRHGPHRRQGADLVRPGQRHLPPPQSPDGLKSGWALQGSTGDPRRAPAALRGGGRAATPPRRRPGRHGAQRVRRRGGGRHPARGGHVDPIVLPALRVEGSAAVRALTGGKPRRPQCACRRKWRWPRTRGQHSTRGLTRS